MDLISRACVLVFLCCVTTAPVLASMFGGGCGSSQCRLSCPMGLKRDARGCKICACRSGSTSQMSPQIQPIYRPIILIPVKCSAQNCKATCTGDYQRDSRGCPTCTCKQSNTGTMGTMGNNGNMGMNNNMGIMNNMGNYGNSNNYKKKYNNNNNGFGNMGLMNSMGMNNMGMMNTMGMNNMGRNTMGRNNMGMMNNIGMNNMGMNNMGMNNMGINNMGMNNMGRNTMGRNNMGMNTNMNMCPRALCRKQCSMGYITNANGCRLCRCKTGFNGNFKNGLNSGYNKFNNGFNTGLNSGYNKFNNGFNNGLNSGVNNNYGSNSLSRNSGFLSIPCPPGIRKVRCLVSPCLQAKCFNFPTATCVESYCGGCNAAFYLNKRRIFC